MKDQQRFCLAIVRLIAASAVSKASHLDVYFTIHGLVRIRGLRVTKEPKTSIRGSRGGARLQILSLLHSLSLAGDRRNDEAERMLDSCNASQGYSID